MSATATRLSVILLAVASLGYVGEAKAQLRTPPTIRVPQKGVRPSPSPDVLYEELAHPDPKSQFSAAEQRIDALDVLGIGGSEFGQIRLTYDDLDGDRIPEALFIIQSEDGTGVDLVILKQKGSQWYRLASPREFSCWCKDQESLIDTFAEIQYWGYDKNEPTKLLFLREKGGGTGGYEIRLTVFSLQGFEMKQAFRFTEERVGCGPQEPVKCDLDHVELKTVDAPDQSHALLALSHQRKDFAGEFWDDTWWIGSPIQDCKAYTWNSQGQQLLENPKASAAYCGHLGRQPSPAARQ